MRIDWAAPILIAAFTILDSLQRWYWSFDVDVSENGLLPVKRVAWGTIRARSDWQWDRRYFIVKLPGVYWEHDLYRLREAWHNRGLLWIQGEGWREIFMPCPDRES